MSDAAVMLVIQWGIGAWLFFGVAEFCYCLYKRFTR